MEAQTVSPLRANSRAVARPIPVEVPVIKAVNMAHSLARGPLTHLIPSCFQMFQ